MIKRLLFYWYALCLPFLTAGQTANSSKTPQRHTALQFAVDSYGKFIGRQALIYNGIKYQEPLRQTEENHPYFLTSTMEEGSIWYESERYDNVALQYDIWRDDVIIEHYDQAGYGAKLKLFKSKVSRFELLDHVFILIKSDSAQFQSGFYELLYDGKVKLVARRFKSYQEEISYKGVDPIFTAKDRYFIIQNDMFHPANNKRAVIKVLKDKKKQLAEFARDKKLRFDDRDRDLVALVRYYDQN